MYTIYFHNLILLIALFSLLWLVSVKLGDASIADIFWGPGFLVSAIFYFLQDGPATPRKIMVLILVALWSIRLCLHIFLRNAGKGEDFRYREFRRKYGEKRYWWISYFQTFLLQGLLMWLISVTLLGAICEGNNGEITWSDIAGLVVMATGLLFESFSDRQLVRFRSDPANKGKVLSTGLWKYSRHPNYFGDAMVWCGFALLSVSAGHLPEIAGAILMVFLLVRVSGVVLLEKTLKNDKPGYAEYMRRTPAFIPWFPKK